MGVEREGMKMSSRKARGRKLAARKGKERAKEEGRRSRKRGRGRWESRKGASTDIALAPGATNA